MGNRRIGSRGVARADREALIVEAAIEEFGIGGWQGSSVAAVAARAEVSKALVLAYFGTKDALYCAAVRTVAEPLLERVRFAVSSNSPGWPMALATIRAIAESVEARPRDWTLVDVPVEIGDPESAAEYKEIRAQFHEQAEIGVRALLDSAPGDFDSHDVDLLCHLWESIVTAAMTWWMEHPGEPIDSLLARVAQIIGTLQRG